MSHAGGTYRGRTGGIYLPAEWDGVVEAILGLDNRPQARPHFRTRPPLGNIVRHAATPMSFTPPQVAALYGYPAGEGAGQCVALIELGGGYRPSDLGTYFGGVDVAAPTVTAVSVDHATNSPTGDADGPDGEVMLDIEVVGSIAPGARIAVYFAPNTDAGFLDAITSAIHDTSNDPSVLSISWGGAESTWTSQAMTAMDEAFQAAVAMGITVCIAAGDGGSSDGVGGGGEHVDFPASSPHVLACGGTSLKASPTQIASETVWNDGASGGATGGGISSFFAVPAWQRGLSALTTAGESIALNMRGVPDVAGDADPATGYQVRVDGSDTVIGGTSAVAPLWAALIARINASSGKAAGFVNAQLYPDAQAFRDVTQGNNGDYAAQPGWDACTGLGSPNGAVLVRLL
jgi:kumamolisin